jgi:hypothetical protein
MLTRQTWLFGMGKFRGCQAEFASAPRAGSNDGGPLLRMRDGRVATMSEISAPLRQFLTWVTERPRRYADVMEEWRSSCPRLTVWEDASIAGHVALEGGPRGRVVLTDAGRAALALADPVPVGPRARDHDATRVDRIMIQLSDLRA